jgi:methylmalonyl-CoA/ethylmalonyl-CoA epimerase
MLDDRAFRFHHLGLACRDLGRELDGWRALGYRPEGEAFTDPIQKIHGQFIVGPGPRLELLTPTAADSAAAGFIDRGTKLYHQAFEVDGLDDAIARMKGLGARVTTPPAPAVAFGGRRIVFLMTPTLNLIELIEAA